MIETNDEGRSRIVRWDGGRMPGIADRVYKSEDGSFEGVVRRLVAAPETAAFDVRYFEVAPDGYTSLERHRHVHVVVCMRGRGVARLGTAQHTLEPGDIVCVPPLEVHQFRNAGPEPFGFLCIVDRDRDRPQPVREGA